MRYFHGSLTTLRAVPSRLRAVRSGDAAVASWFETREDALLTMRVCDLLLSTKVYILMVRSAATPRVSGRCFASLGEP